MLVFQKTGRTDVKYFKEFQRTQIIDLSNHNKIDTVNLIERICGFSPEIALLSMQKKGFFFSVAKRLKSRGCTVIAASDNYWKNSLRDYINAALSIIGIFNSYDCVMVPGHLGRIYAEKIGFQKEHIFEGLYACQTDIFRTIGINRHKDTSHQKWPNTFLYIGQLIPIKGIQQLLSAYEYYRRRNSNPWRLVIVGDGPLKTIISSKSGIDYLGYQTPEVCASIMQSAGAFILPSLKDHWGVVIHEAACAGLPIIASMESGAAVELVRDGYNGFKYPARKWKILAKFMQIISNNDDIRKFGKASLTLSYQFDPVLWSEKLCISIPNLLQNY
jgi:glycosyltransferase involved in cell wall biosynthesis